MPTNWTPWDWVALATATRLGASARQGEHQEPHSLRTMTLPLKAERESCDPSTVLPEISGAAGRSPLGTLVISPVPWMNLVSAAPDDAPPDPESEPQPVSANASDAAAARAAAVRRLGSGEASRPSRRGGRGRGGRTRVRL